MHIVETAVTETSLLWRGTCSITKYCICTESIYDAQLETILRTTFPRSVWFCRGKRVRQSRTMEGMVR